MIPDDVVEEVRARADIVGVIGDFVNLKKAGKDFKGLCPFHDERTPSFHVIPSKAMYHCFGCQKSGDVFRFLMERSGVDFVTAVKSVGARSGVEVREVRGKRPEDDPNRALYEANAFARDFYTEALWDEERGVVARGYLEERGISRQVAERFGLGFAPEGWRNLREAALKHGIDDDVLLEVGLTKRSDRDPKEEPYDRLRDRVIFPIHSLGGKVVGFGGRVLPGSSSPAKYLNSPESVIYQKSDLLYGLDRAKNDVRRAGSVLVVEGYMDVVSLAAAGVSHVVAVLGTALTDRHAELLKRFTSRVFLLFDSDRAGLKATFRAADALLAQGLHPSVITLPDGEDPDSVAQAGGSAALQPFIDQAVDVLDRKIQILEERDYFSSLDKKRRAVDRLLPTLRAVADPTLRDMYVERVASRLGVQRATLEAELAQPAQGSRADTGARSGPARPRRPSGPRAPRMSTRIRGMGAERQLLLLLIKDRTWIERGREEVAPDEFDDQTYRQIYEALLVAPDLTHAPTDLPDAVRNRLDELLADSSELSEAARVFSESVARIKGTPVDRRLQALDQEIFEATDRGDEERAQALLAEKQRLSRERAEGEMSSNDWRRTSHKTLGMNRRTVNDGGPRGSHDPPMS